MASAPSVQLGIFESETRIEIINLLLSYQIMSLSQMSKKFLENYGRKISLPGLLRHVRELENAGIIRQDSGFLLPTPDARTRVYIIQGKDRVEEVLQGLVTLKTKLTAGMVFSELSKCARYLMGRETILQLRDREILERMIEKCESEDVFCHLTNDEKKKLEFWKGMVSNKKW